LRKKEVLQINLNYIYIRKSQAINLNTVPYLVWN